MYKIDTGGGGAKNFLKDILRVLTFSLFILSKTTLETRSRPKDVMRTSIITSGTSGDVVF